MLNSSNVSILIVDDEQAVAFTLEKLVKKVLPECKIMLASDGQEAWDIINHHHPNLVLSDLNMPVMDGMQLLIKLRANPDFNDTLFIMVTGVTDSAERIKALDKGADEFITKPIISDALEARLKSAMRIIGLQNRMKEENQLLVDLAEELERDVQDMARLSVKFMQARIPASYDTLQRIAEASVWIAKELRKLSNEDIRNVEIAAFLSHAGRMSLPDNLIKHPVMINGKPTDNIMLQVPSAAKEIVSSVRRFDEVGRILYHIYENIDGSGFPGRLQSWQIPFPSRIIRAVIDYEELKSYFGKSSKEALEQLHSEAKRLYDHRVVILLEQYVRSHNKDEFPITDIPILLSELKDGMTITRDIITENGMKLMPAGAILRTAVIQKIIAHNASDPIIGNVYVKK